MGTSAGNAADEVKSTRPAEVRLLETKPQSARLHNEAEGVVTTDPAADMGTDFGGPETANAIRTVRARPKVFLELPEDIQSMVLGFVIRPTDLVSVCLTCKNFHELAVKYLYQVVELDLGGDGDEKLPAFLSPTNIGLKHIREVELYRADVTDKCDNQLRQASFAIRMLLEMLPRDQLKLFRWHPWDIFSAENMSILFRKQKKLEWVGVIRLDKTFDDEMCKKLNLDTALSNVKKLGLYPDSLDTLEFCHEVLKRVPLPDKITLHTNFELDEERSGFVPELYDTPIEPGLLTSTIFRHLLPFHKCTPITPAAVNLEICNLRYCTNTYCQVIDFSRVEKLSVCLCTGADALLAAMCNSSRLPKKLVKFEFKHDDDEEECAATNALDTFLCLVSGIETLTIDIGGTKRLPNPTSITRHAKTLTWLNCHAWRQKVTERGPYDEKVFEREAFEKITKACWRIEQLSLAFPATFIGRRNTEDFDAFSACLGNLPSLVTCNITTFPLNKSSSASLPRKMYEHLLSFEALEGFESSILNAATKSQAQEKEATINPNEPRFTTSKLNVLAWGISDKIFDRDDSKNVMLFVKSRTLDPLGGPCKVAAVRMSMCLKHYHEPRTGILDVPLSRSARPPTKENEDIDDW